MATTAIAGAPPRARPAHKERPAAWCALCSAPIARFTPDGEGRCWACWILHATDRFAACCPDPEIGRSVVAAMIPAHYPFTPEQILRRACYHMLRRAEQPDRLATEAMLRLDIADALDALVAAGTLVRMPRERYVWGAAALELLPPTCIGERRWDGEPWP